MSSALIETFDPEIFSGVMINGQRLTWREVAEQQRSEIDDLRKFKGILMDLDRCQHGTREGDHCFECQFTSQGNPLILKSGHIGFTPSRRAIVMPHRADKADPAKWIR